MRPPAAGGDGAVGGVGDRCDGCGRQVRAPPSWLGSRGAATGAGCSGRAARRRPAGGDLDGAGAAVSARPSGPVLRRCGLGAPSVGLGRGLRGRRPSSPRPSSPASAPRAARRGSGPHARRDGTGRPGPRSSWRSGSSRRCRAHRTGRGISVLVSPSSLASSCTRMFFAKTWFSLSLASACRIVVPTAGKSSMLVITLPNGDPQRRRVSALGTSRRHARSKRPAGARRCRSSRIEHSHAPRPGDGAADRPGRRRRACSGRAARLRPAAPAADAGPDGHVRSRRRRVILLRCHRLLVVARRLCGTRRLLTSAVVSAGASAALVDSARPSVASAARRRPPGAFHSLLGHHRSRRRRATPSRRSRRWRPTRPRRTRLVGVRRPPRRSWVSLWMSTRTPVRRAARRAFWPSLPMARESW